MNRKIKFRVWEDAFKLMDYEPHPIAPLHKLDFNNWMQWTGKRDINNKEIYEGDIVKDLSPYADLYETPGLYENNKVVIPLLVVWSQEDACFRLVGDWLEEEQYYQYGDQISNRRLEIIGNIYQNKELMENNT